ncbi:amidohydrolase family protein [Pedobacter sp. Du54]|uniref:amidohydrolase family protein n=1 Tax=Pedobacter anseongensis TaxID=3133439 RepID=UPI003098EC52
MIDSHVHFWNFDRVRDSWITPEMAAIRHDFTPEDFVNATSTTPVSGCIAVQADQTEEQNQFLLSLAENNSVIKGIVGWVDFLDPNLEERLIYWKNFPLIKGWRHVLQAENDAFILNPSFVNGLQQLKNFNYTYDLLCFHHQLTSIIKLVDQLQNQPFVLDHCGKPDVKRQDLKTWESHIKELAQNKNVFCKVSGLLAEADWKNWKEIELFNCFDVIFKHFGTDRIIYGSDWPVMLISRPYEDWLSLVSKYVSKFDKIKQEYFFSGNAHRFYNLTSLAK